MLNLEIDWLNSQIDLMQAGRSLRPAGPVKLDEPGESIAMLRMAAQLNSLRPGALDPDPVFDPPIATVLFCSHELDPVLI